MKTLKTIMIMSTLVAGSALADTLNFADAKVGEAPGGWTATKTGKGEAKWTIEKDVQSHEATDDFLGLLIFLDDQSDPTARPCPAGQARPCQESPGSLANRRRGVAAQYSSI